MTELLDALYRGDDDRVSELLAADPELNVFEAAAFGRTDRLLELLDDDPARANAFGDDGFQPLGLSCFFGHVESARLLLDGAPVEMQVERCGAETRYELCELLLDRGADPNLEQGGGFTALDAARQNGDERLERLLLDRGARTGERRLDGAH